MYILCSTQMAPFGICAAYVSMQRIDEFLKEGEVPEWASTLTASTHGENIPSDGEVGFDTACFEWQGTPKSGMPARFRLGPIDVKFPKAKLTLVSGATGSGKSALLAALLGGESPYLSRHL
jgi:ABC-type siderophore export system fused ATPase/permease subunit